jgi:SAM-dependent methyltransferase
MSLDRNPQAAQMADESMIRTLALQAVAIWPQEEPLFARYGLGVGARIADIGCGGGEITARLARRFADADIVGIDILQSSIDNARRWHGGLAPRVRFEQGDAFDLKLPADQFDLVVCRHVIHSVPQPERVLAGLHGICKPGGWLHVLSEDYGMLHMTPRLLDPDRLWNDGAIAYGENTGTDLRIGRRTFGLMRGLQLADLRVDYVVVDTQRVSRDVFAGIMRAWRDGYADILSDRSRLKPGEARALFDDIIAGILDPDHYAVWQVPVISGRKVN